MFPSSGNFISWPPRPRLRSTTPVQARTPQAPHNMPLNFTMASPSAVLLSRRWGKGRIGGVGREKQEEGNVRGKEVWIEYSLNEILDTPLALTFLHRIRPWLRVKYNICKKCFRGGYVTRKIKHYNIFCKCFILHVTTVLHSYSVNVVSFANSG